MKNQLFFFSSFRYVTYLLILALVFTSCQGVTDSSDPVEITFVAGPDDSGSLQYLIEQFNDQNQGEIIVSWRVAPRSTSDYYVELAKDLAAGESDADVMATDVIWTPLLANKEWVEDLTTRFFEDYNSTEFINAAMESATFQYRMWGVPWFTDAAIMFYRKDLLEKSGIKYPPATWSEVIEYSRKIKKDSGIEHGYVFQGAEYEGGVTNACEFIWNSGGDILMGDLPVFGHFDESAGDTELVLVNSPKAQKGLQEAERLVKSGVVPANIQDYHELESNLDFQQGRAAFLRSWASAYALLLDPLTKVKPEQVGLTPLPTSERNMTPYSCQGGWNLVINARSSQVKKDASWKLIRFLISEESQRYRAINGMVLPCLRRLYKDEQLIAQAPVVGFARQVIPICKKRPKSPYYPDMSPVIANVFNRLLKGEINPETAISTLEKQLEDIIMKKNSKKVAKTS